MKYLSILLEDSFKSSRRITFGIYRSIKGLSTGEAGNGASQAEEFRMGIVLIGRNVQDKPDFCSPNLQHWLHEQRSAERGQGTLR